MFLRSILLNNILHLLILIIVVYLLYRVEKKIDKLTEQVEITLLLTGVSIKFMGEGKILVQVKNEKQV